MTSVIDFGTDALMEAGLHDPEEALPARDAERMLRQAIGMFRDLVGNGAFGTITPVIISANYDALENVRVVTPTGGPYTITKPDTIEDEDAEDGERPPRERSIIEVAGATPELWIYEARLGGWVDVLTLALADEMPMSASFGNDFISYFATILARRNPGATVNPLTQQAAARFMRALTASYDSTRQVSEGVYY